MMDGAQFSPSASMEQTQWILEQSNAVDSRASSMAGSQPPSTPGSEAPSPSGHQVALALQGQGQLFQELVEPKVESELTEQKPKVNPSSSKGGKKGGAKGSKQSKTEGGASSYTTSRWSHKTQAYHVTPTGSLLEEVLNEKKMALMKSPEVIEFLQGLQEDVRDKKQADVVPRPTCSGQDRRHILAEARLRHPSGDRMRRMSGESCRSRHQSGEGGRMRHPSGEMSNRRMRYVSGDSARKAMTVSSGDGSKPHMPTPGGSIIQTRGQMGKLAAQLANLTSQKTEVKTERPSPDALMQQQHGTTDIWSKGASAFSTVASSAANQNS